MKIPVIILRAAGIIEGISWLLLLFVAMPLKYLWDTPKAVTMAGMAHGALFIQLCAILAWVMWKYRWPIKRGLKVFAAALIPFGPIFIDKDLKKWAAETSGAGSEA